MSTVPAATSKLPLTVVTGFLGAGKTAMLNRILAGGQACRLAVIINELGPMDVDGRILKSTGGTIVELPGGCVCHEAGTQAQLWELIERLTDSARFDRIVLETTGIAEPQPIVEALEKLPPRRKRVFIEGVIAVVDASQLNLIEEHTEARAQIRQADRILLTKLELAPNGSCTALWQILMSLNAHAERAAFPLAWESARELQTFAFRPCKARPRPSTRHAHRHSHISVMTLKQQKPMPLEPLLAFCRSLGTRLWRAKGFVDVQGEPRQVFVEKSGDQLNHSYGLHWPEGPRQSDVVFIGEFRKPATDCPWPLSFIDVRSSLSHENA